MKPYTTCFKGYRYCHKVLILMCVATQEDRVTMVLQRKVSLLVAERRRKERESIIYKSPEHTRSFLLQICSLLNETHNFALCMQ